MPEIKITATCFACGREHQTGPHRWEGHWLKGYDIQVCNNCWEANWEGWDQMTEGRLLAHMKANSIAVPARNKNGRLPRQYPEK